mgnify:CR=1 FL=1
MVEKKDKKPAPKGIVKLKKGSQEAKDYMAKLRAKRNKGKK